MYARLVDVQGTLTRRLKDLLPHVSNPENLSDLESRFGIVEVERTNPSRDWWQGYGEEVVDTSVRPVTITRPVQDRPLEQVKAMAWERVKQWREEALGSGLTWTFPDGTTGTIQIREQDVRNLLSLHGAALVLQADPEAQLRFTDGENVAHLMSPPEMIQMTMAVFGLGNTLHEQSQTKRAAIEAASSVADVLEAMV